MKSKLRSLLTRLTVFSALIFGMSDLSAQPAPLSIGDITHLGYRMPESIKSLIDQSEYQQRYPTSQKLFVTWDSMNGAHQVRNRSDVANLYLKGKFSLDRREQGLHYSPGRFDPGFYGEQLLVVATTSAKEVRAITEINDSRMGYVEDSGQHPSRTDLYIPYVHLIIDLPDDPSIQHLEFVKRNNGTAGADKLIDLGGLDIQLPNR
jgi:hypothetical protein